MTDLTRSLLDLYRRNTEAYHRDRRWVAPRLLAPGRWDIFFFERPMPTHGAAVDWSGVRQHIEDTRIAGLIEFGTVEYSVGGSHIEESEVEEFCDQWRRVHPDTNYDEPEIQEEWEQFWYRNHDTPAPTWDDYMNGYPTEVVQMRVEFRPKV